MNTRTEHDSLGPVEVPVERLWGAQTERSRQNFRISGERMPRELLLALTEVKRAAALVNKAQGALPPELADNIVRAADEVLAGRHDEQFPLLVWQTGSGTQSNMNVNEVLANRASELQGGARGEGRLVHPNDHVNRGQSSNDVFPTAMAVAASLALHARVLPEVRQLAAVLREKSERFARLIKLGRTHMMDATPLTFGQELGGWAAQLEQGARHIESAQPHLAELALGGTAVGTGLNAPPGFGTAVARELSARLGLPFASAPNKFEALAAHDALTFAHGALKTLAASLSKIANDVRLLGSGPRAGLAELRLPENEPGSSIMPGKVNPTQCEALTMACAQVFGNDVAINIGASSGQLQLNVYKPLIAHNFLQSARLLADGCQAFRELCIDGLEPDEARMQAYVQRSLMLVTALTPHIGYEAAAKIAQQAMRDDVSLREAALALGVESHDFDAWVRPEAMV